MATLKILLTEPEAKALLHALGNSTDYGDIMESLFPNKTQRNNAWRAEEKIKRELSAVLTTRAL